jgi:UDP-N-acetylglucosamine 4,6-dehydratase
MDSPALPLHPLSGKTILITGGTGSWGSECLKQILLRSQPREIRVYSRGEALQVKVRREFNADERLRFIVGDVRDSERLNLAMKHVDLVIHLAALKHVPVCEENPYEAVKTNIVGTQNIIDAAIDNEVPRVLEVSSDKAVSPLNLYGATKAVAEKLIISANNIGDTRFSCLRAGNVLGTAGSVVPLFRAQLLGANKVTLTDGRMTRFFNNLTTVVGSLVDCCEKFIGGETYITKMPAMRISDLAEVMIQELGEEGAQLIEIGKRPGEKLHELLVSQEEAERTFDAGQFLLLMPQIQIRSGPQAIPTSSLPHAAFVQYSSDGVTPCTKNEIREMLAREGWLSKRRNNNDSSNTTDELLRPFEREGWTKSK